MSDAPQDPFDRLDSVAVAPVLLVASDYDGTIAPIVEDPQRAFPLRETMVALERLASMPQTHVALISGRALRDLAMLTGSSPSIQLVGSHGSELEPGFADRLSPESKRSLARLVRDLEKLTTDVEGAVLERKPGGVAVHYRKVADEDAARELVERIVAGPAAGDGIHLRHGKRVVELSVVATDKGKALDFLRRRTGASIAIYLGDDQTDEDVFRVLHGPDLSIKIGRGPTLARARLDDPHDVGRFLALLAERRGHWLAGA